MAAVAAGPAGDLAKQVAERLPLLDASTAAPEARL